MSELRTTHCEPREKVAVIIPAYNEEERITSVLEVVLQTPLVNEVIVVNDGSTDKTAEVVSHYPAKLVNREANGGKGAALVSGIEATKADILAFVDADLVGLKERHLEEMIKPLLDDPSISMTVGKFKGGRTRTDLAQVIAPNISGQRVVRRSFLEGMPDFSKARYGVEIAFTRHAKQSKSKTKEVLIDEATHVMKEEKLGWTRGFLSRLQMYLDIVRHYLVKK